MVQKKTVKKKTAKKAAKAAPKSKPASKPKKKSAVSKPVSKGRIIKKTMKKAAKKSAVPAKAKPARKSASKSAAPKARAAKKTASKAKTKAAAIVKPAKAAKKIAKKSVPQKLRVAEKALPPRKVEIVEKTPVQESVGGMDDLSEQMAYGMYGGIQVCEHPKPFPKRTPYTDREIKFLHDILVEERARMRDLIRSIDEMTLRRPNDEVDSTVPTHIAENATDNQQTETTLLLRRDAQNSLMQVEAALERLESGLYGVCMACGSKVGMDRLKAKPEAHLCMTCQKTYSEKSSGR